MRRIGESPAMLQRVIRATGLPSSRVKQVVAALQDVIDETFLDGYSIFVPPFVLAYPSDPIAKLFDQMFDAADRGEIDAWFNGDDAATARWLGIPEDQYRQHPVASALTITVRLFKALGLGNELREDHDDVLAIAEAWFDTYNKPRLYHFSRVGLESDLERWIVHHPERLTDLGYPVRLRHQQLVLPDRRRLDLVFDLLEDNRTIGTLVAELKTVGGYLEAVDQLVGYLNAVASHGLSAGILRGLLVADGFTPDVEAYAAEHGIETLTLSALGYRAALATGELPVGRPHADHTPNLTEPSMTEKDLYLLDAGKPFLLIRADDAGNIREVVKLGDNEWQFNVAQKELVPAGLTPSQLVRFFGREAGLMPVAEYEQRNRAMDAGEFSYRLAGDEEGPA
jgi:hypothetical protein